jgi:ribonuclease T2
MLRRFAENNSSMQLLGGTAGNFDFYLLSTSWQAEFCDGKKGVYPGCKVPGDFWKSHFTLHGLWPQYNTGSVSAQPAFCGDEPLDRATLEKAIGRDVLETYWPNVKYSVDSPDHAEFWEHEWDRHGSCSGLDQVTYFTQAINMLRSAKDNLTPLFVQNNVGNFVNVNELRAAFGGPEYVSMVCNGNDLAEVRTCYAKGKDNSVAGRRPCPHNVLGSDDCTSTTVRINSFYVK